MLTFGAFAFATPWALAALVVLPAIVWLLRVTPPSARRLRFPAIELLRGIAQREETPARTPWWLLALRLLTSALIIIALAAPLLHPRARLDDGGPIVMVVDNGWAAGRNWPARTAAMNDLIARADRAGRSLIVIPTAPPPGADAVTSSPALPAIEARRLVQTLAPEPWSADRSAAAAAIEAMSNPKDAIGVWIADGLDGPGATRLGSALRTLGAAEILVEGDEDRPVHLLLPPTNEGKALSARVMRARTGVEETLTVRMTATDGRLLARQTVTLAPGDLGHDVHFEVPTELRNEAAALRIEGETTAGATVVLDERWRRRPVGLVSDQGQGRDQPLLSDLYYVSRALEPFNEIRRGTIGELLKHDLSAIVLTDVGMLAPSDQEVVDRWIRKGGVLIRFAGPKLARQADTLIPVRLRYGDRALGGAMSWADPAHLQPFDDKSPFAGLAIPPDVIIQRQVLSEPALDLADRTLARLGDGTPLVTSEKRGDGMLVLVHTTAGPEWSNLPLSGLYVDMLRRLVGLSHGIAGRTAGVALDPINVEDGWGRLGPPPTTALPLPATGEATVSSRHPPGFYGREDTRVALNLTAGLTRLASIPIPPGITRHAYDERAETALGPGLLALALALVAVDLLIALWLRGLLGARRIAVLGLFIVGLTALTGTRTADAADTVETVTGQTHLAYVKTGDETIDAVSRAGLAGLAEVLALRTSVEPGVAGPIDVERDELAFYPLLYWPATPRQPPLSEPARERINAYLHNGGLILFDSLADRGDAGAVALRTLTTGLDIPPLVEVPPDHVLTRSFYLIQDFPGRSTGAPVWVEAREGGANDGVSSVVIGGNDWAAAWATDARGLAMFAATPGGERQREIAYRFGVNLVMYALTGNYKADQLHVPAILERLGQ